MLRGVLQKNLRVCCPTCLENDHVVYRREPTGDRGIANHCRCNRCGEWFIYEQDKVGMPKVA
ncbi:MAG: hypothetical protein A2Z34_07490 [Planctomycetes bacterium RBG_16_59_8]|nr:MAG: hypothetical protein A2Z34_07490 [Planctomycetes bacterium RBG_16_59_8]